MQARAIASLIVVLAIAAAGRAAAQPEDGAWSGQVACEALPALTMGQLRAPFTLTIDGGRARYERELMDPMDTARPTGVFERGTGAVGDDGSVALSGGASGRTWSYIASYRGRIEGNALRLSGTQSWRYHARAGLFERKCSIALAR
jgi:hypothetical protein